MFNVLKYQISNKTFYKILVYSYAFHLCKICKTSCTICAKIVELPPLFWKLVLIIFAGYSVFYKISNKTFRCAVRLLIFVKLVSNISVSKMLKIQLFRCKLLLAIMTAVNFFKNIQIRTFFKFIYFLRNIMNIISSKNGKTAILFLDKIS